MKRVLVTGSSRGIGRAISQKLASDGWGVAVHYANDRGAAEETRRLIGSAERGLYQADLGNVDGVSSLWEQVIADGEVDAVVNNAGIYRQQQFLETDMEDYARIFRVNLEAPLRLIQLACRRFVLSGGGKVLNVASRVGFKGEGNAAYYAASKAALINLTRSLAVELAPANIQLFGIAPGWVDTAMAREGMEDRLPEILTTLPLGRMASPEDCAAAASFLLSDAASYLSGQVIDINGASYFH